MSGFYSEMADVVSELLAPEAQGGFGQGTITLARSVPGTPDPETPWIPAEPTTTVYTLKGAAAAILADEATAKYVDGTTILASDVTVTCAVPAVTPNMTDIITIDGVAKTLKKIVTIPAAGTPVAVKFIVQG